MERLRSEDLDQLKEAQLAFPHQKLALHIFSVDDCSFEGVGLLVFIGVVFSGQRDHGGGRREGHDQRGVVQGVPRGRAPRQPVDARPVRQGRARGRGERQQGRQQHRQQWVRKEGGEAEGHHGVRRRVEGRGRGGRRDGRRRGRQPHGLEPP